MPYASKHGADGLGRGWTQRHSPVGGPGRRRGAVGRSLRFRHIDFSQPRPALEETTDTIWAYSIGRQSTETLNGSGTTTRCRWLGTAPKDRMKSACAVTHNISCIGHVYTHHTRAQTHTNTHISTDTHTHARTHARTHAHTHTHARTHALTHARTHANIRSLPTVLPCNLLNKIQR